MSHILSYASAMEKRLNENAHKDAFRPYTDCWTEDLANRAKKNVDEGLALMCRAHFEDAAKCFVDAGNLSMMLYAQALEYKYVLMPSKQTLDKKLAKIQAVISGWTRLGTEGFSYVGTCDSVEELKDLAESLEKSLNVLKEYAF